MNTHIPIIKILVIGNIFPYFIVLLSPSYFKVNHRYENISPLKSDFSVTLR